MKFDNIKVKLIDLKLDLKNYRIISNINTEQEILDYLYKYEDLGKILFSITKNPFIAGERIVVRQNDDQTYRVCEGNRRVASYKFLTGILSPQTAKIKTPDIVKNNNDILKADMLIDCDLIYSDADESGLLIKRHVEGPKKWKTLAKFRNIYELVEKDGTNVKRIAESYGISLNQINSMLKKYAIFLYAQSLSKNLSNSEVLNDPMLKLDPFLRMFFSKSEVYDGNLYSMLKLKFNVNKFSVSSPLKKLVLKKAFSILLNKTLLAAQNSTTVSTRNKIEDIPELVALLKSLNHNKVNIKSSNTIKVLPKKRQLKFVGLLTKFDDNCCSHGIVQIVGELQWLSKTYKMCNSSLAILFLSRSLLESSLKYFLERKHPTILSNSTNQHGDYSLSKLISNVSQNSKHIFENNKRIEKIFLSFERGKNKEKLDRLIHSPEMFSGSEDEVRSIVDGELFEILKYFVNN